MTTELTHSIPSGWLIAPTGSIIALLFAYIFYKGMRKSHPGEPEMVRIAGFVKVGAMAYLRQQYKVVAMFFVVMVILLATMAFVFKIQSGWVPFAFLTGGFFSGLCGYLGMKTATEASSRTAYAAKESLNKGLVVAFRSGAVMGLIVVGFGLLDICAWFYVLYELVGMDLHEVTVTMLCFGMGASTQALFARVGGGIYTKAADVGADLVGKVEAGIPEDDPRNPAVIADNVGDNVGDVAGMGADLYESYCGSILAAAALGAATAFSLGLNDPNKIVLWVILPLIIGGIGNIFSVLGIYAVRTGETVSQKLLMKALFRGINLTSFMTLIISGVVIYLVLPEYWVGLWLAMVCGLVAGLVIGKSTEYYTSSDFKPTQEIAKQAETGPATVVIAGVSVGMLSTIIPVLTVCLGTVLAFGLSGGFSDPIRGLYGIALAAVGMLSNLGITLATDAYGPIADNAGGNAQMTRQPPFVRERTDALDSLGNTTAATGKGFAIGSAALTALALIAAYIEEVRIGMERAGMKLGEIIPKDATLQNFMEFFKVYLMNPLVLIGIFIGAMLSFGFVGMTLRAVGRAANKVVLEVRRQFKEIPGLLEGKPGAVADYSTCVEIATRSAQREMILPSMMAIFSPVVVGLVLGVSGVIGMLTGALACGFALAVMLANSGGAWDNAKKWIEVGKLGGKGSFAHKAAVTGDTVGDPFKDTSGPSLNILIKLMAMVSIVFAGMTVKYSPVIAQWLGISGK
ncbi:MAG: sodium-translocating pyrophosphatase [Planctomycetota bacterium]|nr:sodium-translocating pyrophosphatase [Planctomycetota bacterium]MDI6787367.1 sodium-translocating pyrophosphatase [Planctomycetota bacterium]